MITRIRPSTIKCWRFFFLKAKMIYFFYKYMTTKIDISDKSIIRVILWILFFYGLYYFRSIVFVLFLSVILASVVNRIVSFFKRFNVPRAVTVVAFYLLSLFSIFIVFYFFLPGAIEYISTTLKKLPEFLNNLDYKHYWNVSPW